MNPAFKERVLEIVDDFLIDRFDKKSGNASAYYNIDNEDRPDPQTEE